MNNYQVYIFLALLAFSGLSALYRKVQEKRVINEGEANRRQRADEALRTGRDPGLAGNPARNLTDETTKVRQERELADSRSQQEDRLRQLREKISGQSTQAGGSAGNAGRPQGQPQPGQGVELWPGGPVVVINPTGQTGPSGQGGQGTSLPRPVMADSARSPQPRQQAQQQAQQKAQQQAQQAQRQAQQQAQSQRGQQQFPKPTPNQQQQQQQAPQQSRQQQGRSTATPSRQQQQQQQRPQVKAQQRSRDDATPKVSRESMTDRAGTLAMTRRAEAEQAAESRAVELRRTNEIERSGRIVPQTLDQWRAALVANEVLGVPMGLR